QWLGKTLCAKADALYGWRPVSSPRDAPFIRVEMKNERAGAMVTTRNSQNAAFEKSTSPPVPPAATLTVRPAMAPPKAVAQSCTVMIPDAAVSSSPGGEFFNTRAARCG